MTGQTNILERILTAKRDEIADFKARTDLKDLRRRAEKIPPPRDFAAALRQCPHAAVIAEIKKASPSLGSINPALDPAAQAGLYCDGGAAALSVLTDGPFFGGRLEDLTEARLASGLPVLRKDFIIDPAQLYQAAVAGADAVLLIVAALDFPLLTDLFRTARDLGLTPLVEVHNEAETETALHLDPPLLGINNRDLTTLSVSLETCLRIRPLVPPDTTVVAESGITGPDDVARLIQGGLNAFLIGTTLMRAHDPAAMLRAICRAGNRP